MSRFVAGQTGLIVAVPAVEPVVGRVRSAYDLAAAYGVPAHVTVLFPFLPHDAVDAGVAADLAGIAGSVPAFEVTFARFRRWPGVGWLEPEPDPSFRSLTAVVARRWPDHRPYGGAFDDPVPHLTVAEGDDRVLDLAEAEVAPGLPVTTRVDRLDLIAFDGERWRPVAHWALG
jgi:2'-5' RNA ligase